MSDVALDVGGRRYTVSCSPGEEDNVRHLATLVDAKLTAMKANLSSNEAKNLLFAALLLANDAEEAQAGTAAAPAPPSPDETRLAATLERVATALENAAATFEGR